MFVVRVSDEVEQQLILACIHTWLGDSCFGARHFSASAFSIALSIFSLASATFNSTKHAPVLLPATRGLSKPQNLKENDTMASVWHADVHFIIFVVLGCSLD